MITHLVLWKLKPEARGKSKSENLEEMRLRLKSLWGKVPGLRFLRVVTDIGGDDNWDICLIAQFDSKEGLAAYLVHPFHEEVSNFVSEVGAEKAAIDF